MTEYACKKHGKVEPYVTPGQKRPEGGRYSQRGCRTCRSEYMEVWRSNNRDKLLSYDADKSKWLKSLAMEKYGGPICVCCGEQELAFLTLDHKNGDGAAHRRSILGWKRGAGGSLNMYSWLRSSGWPDCGLRVLCYNCNCGRRSTKGICPHEIKNSSTAKTIEAFGAS